MKNAMKMLALSVAVMGLSACGTGLGNFEDGPPYETGRTATHMGKDMPVAAAPVEVITPSCPPAAAPLPCDCSEWKTRALNAEAQAKDSMEAATRANKEHGESLRK